MFRDAKSQLTLAELLSHDRYHKDGATIIRELLKKESISDEAYFDLIGREVGNKLLEANVFALHVDSHRVTFCQTYMP